MHILNTTPFAVNYYYSSKLKIASSKLIDKNLIAFNSVFFDISLILIIYQFTIFWFFLVK